jgi:hypothetical protein
MIIVWYLFSDIFEKSDTISRNGKLDINIFFIKHLTHFDLMSYIITVILLAYYYLDKVMKETDN